MKVLHIVPSYLPATRYGGPIYSVHGLCKALVKSGHEVTVFTTNVDGPNNSDVPLNQSVDLDGVKVWYFPSKILRRLYWAPGLARALRKQIDTFDVVHLHSVFLWPTWVAARRAQKADVPYIVAPRGMLVQDLINRKSRVIKMAWIRFIEQTTFSQASGVHITAEIERQEIEQFGFDMPPVFYIPNGIEQNDPYYANEIESDVVPDYPYVLFLSRLNWKKGLDRLIRAWRHVTDLRLVIAGNDEEGYRTEIESLARLVGVEDRVEFMGPAHGDDKWSLYKNAEIFVLPSYSENFGIVVLEAMSMGCPVVVTPEVGLAPAVKKSGCGIVVDGDPELLAEAINELIGDAGKRSMMGKKGYQTSQTEFSWTGIASTMTDVYKQMIKRRNPKAAL